MSNKTVKTPKIRSGKKPGKIICAECSAEIGHMKILHGIIKGLCDPCKKALMDRGAGKGTVPDSPDEDETPEDEESVRRVIPLRVIDGGKGKARLDLESQGMIRVLKDLALDLYETHYWR